MSLNSFLEAIFILKFGSFKSGYKYKFSSGFLARQSPSINSFFNKNLLHLLEYIFSSLQLSFLNSGSKLILQESNVDLLAKTSSDKGSSSVLVSCSLCS